MLDQSLNMPYFQIGNLFAQSDWQKQREAITQADEQIDKLLIHMNAVLSAIQENVATYHAMQHLSFMFKYLHGQSCELFDLIEQKYNDNQTAELTRLLRKAGKLRGVTEEINHLLQQGKAQSTINSVIDEQDLHKMVEATIQKYGKTS